MYGGGNQMKKHKRILQPPEPDPNLVPITGLEPRRWCVRKPDLQDNIDEVRREFVGQPEICHKLVEHIIYLRRYVDVHTHWPEFQNIVQKYLPVLLKEYDVRWMVSMLDTMVDFGTPLQKATSMTISTFVKDINMIHFTLLDHVVDGRMVGNKKVAKRATLSGMTTCDIITGDTLSDMNVRLNKTAELDPTVDAIWRVIKGKLRDEPELPLYWLCFQNRFPERQRFFL